MTELLRRYGVEVSEIGAPVGGAPSPEEVREALGRSRAKAIFATHVDTSTGVRVDPEPLCRIAREAGALSVFDGVCATAGERFEMAGWEADVYFTASQKAIGVPPGLALLVASERALAARAARQAGPPPLSLDWQVWLPIHRAYELVRIEAERYGVPVVGSEIVGLIPLDALVGVVDFYLRLKGFGRNQVLEARLLEER